jgi:UDP-N-acetylglucosamine 2-epimerase (non-hydrolysing)/GDP/UDP-N,N'-diacetylbacillosamine 2-epimerase (hydrolysing)
MRKICVVTGSRADYGLLSRLMKLVKEDPELVLQIIATNMHLSPEFGLTLNEIIEDGFSIDKKVEMLLASDTSNATVKSVGLATLGFADALEDLRPDILVVLGDRYEILAAVTAALFFKIPVSHIHGGEITEGAYDDSIRHAVSKMSHLHFTSTEEYRKRVIQLGEDPSRVFNFGAIGLDNLMHLNLLKLDELENRINFKIGKKCILVTFHPVTLENNTAENQMHDLLMAIKSFSELNVIFTLPNSDTGGKVIISMIRKFVKENSETSISYPSLGYLNYMSALQYVCAVVGNSSSGLIEAPSFGIPTLNIGDRQKGRIRPRSVVDCVPTYSDITEKLKYVLSQDFRTLCVNVSNPYYKKNSAEEILNILKNTDIQSIVKKSFCDLKNEEL